MPASTPYGPELDVAEVFGDADGRVIGGVPGRGRPQRGTGDEVDYRTFAPVISSQRIDMPADYIPEGPTSTRS